MVAAMYPEPNSGYSIKPEKTRIKHVFDMEKFSRFASQEIL